MVWYLSFVAVFAFSVVIRSVLHALFYATNMFVLLKHLFFDSFLDERIFAFGVNERGDLVKELVTLGCFGYDFSEYSRLDVINLSNYQRKLLTGKRRAILII